MLNGLLKLLGSTAHNFEQGAIGLGRQVSPFDRGATLTRPMGGNQGTSPFPVSSPVMPYGQGLQSQYPWPVTSQANAVPSLLSLLGGHQLGINNSNFSGTNISYPSAIPSSNTFYYQGRVNPLQTSLQTLPRIGPIGN